MDNKNYDIASAFERIEKELIESMMRNLDRHRAEEDKLGINWSQWQTVQLQALKEYKERNAKKYKTEFKNINSTIDNLIKIYRKEGNTKQEQEILQAIRSGLPYKRQSDAIVGEFIKLNDRKIEALIKATTNDFEKAEIAMLRRANDQYRKIIYSAQVYAATGGTYAKAVDMAAKDFLQAGINCVEYKNGSRHAMKDYADMAIRTAQKRAYLTGEGEKRKEWGEPLVIMNKRGNPCPKCFPWVGLILIDDVWSGGTPEDGPYKLMSTAINAGLYHPRCKDSHSTYFKGITTVDEKTIEDSKRLEEDYKKEQRINYFRQQQEKCERIAKYSLDKDNKRIYQARAKGFENKVITIERALAVRNNKIYGIETINISKISRENIETIDKIFHKIFKEYNISPDEISKIEFCDLGKDIARACIDSNLTMKLKLDKNIFLNKQNLEKILKVPQSGISKKGGLKGYFEHEFTHFLEYKYAIKRNTKNGMVNKKKAYEEIKQSIYATEILKDAILTCNLRYSDDIIETISDYATYNSSEAIAEAVSYCDSDKLLCETIKKIVNKKWK